MSVPDRRYSSIKCLGGGYAIYNSAAHTVKLMGHSIGFGAVNHSLASSVLDKSFGAGTLTIEVGDDPASA